jgi:hypothetical protein
MFRINPVVNIMEQKTSNIRYRASRGNILTSGDVELNLGPFGQGNNTTVQEIFQ